ncbi:hypothetical protein GE09DRAFT_1113579 [Coniochaeta sp. 2T2.1]|nr:hypothetical protein GE09DRAFT_1113579 [Coniochaeta sp. 2T2.1]
MGSITERFVLPARYEIRKLEPHHNRWALAILSHANIFHQELTDVLYPEDRVARCYKLGQANYTIDHCIKSGYSFGVFDTEFRYKREQSAQKGGELYWDDRDLDVTELQLLEQMDFALVSVAMAYDPIDPFDHTKLGPLMAAYPVLGHIAVINDARDSRPEKERLPKGPGERLFRAGTATRVEYEGHGLAKGLAHFLMHHVAQLGFKGVQVDGMHHAIKKIWLNSPAPFTAKLLGEIDSADYEEEVAGKIVKPFFPVSEPLIRVWVSLVPDST